MKDEFLGTISHELRTPLNAVLGWLHLIRTGKLDAATERRGFESIERNVRLQAQLTGDLLDMSKALTGRLQLDMRPRVAARRCVGGGVAGDDAPRRRRTSRSTSTAPDGRVVVRGDANRLRQIIWHLLANAIKFTPRGGSDRRRRSSPTTQACITRARHRPGHRAGVPAAHLRSVHPGGLVADARVGRARRRAVAGARAGRAARRRDPRRATATTGGAEFTSGCRCTRRISARVRRRRAAASPTVARRRSTASASCCSIGTRTCASC